MSKSIFALAIAATMAFSLVGCGEEAAPPAPTTEESVTVPEGSEMEEMEGSETKPMEGSEMKEMEGSEAKPMEGSEHKPMEGEEHQH